MKEEDFFNKFKGFETADYKTKYEASLKFLEENKTDKLKEFDKLDYWEGTNKSNPQIEVLLKDFLGFEFDFSFYVYQNRDLLRINKMKNKIGELLKEGYKEITPFSFEYSNNKTQIKLLIVDKYDLKEIEGRLFKAETEQTLFLIVKGKKRQGYRLTGNKERYFLK